jgi:hypothetical protein
LKTNMLEKKQFARIAAPISFGFVVAAFALALSLPAMESQARDVGPAGGGGGGEFRINCDPGSQVVGFDVVASHVLIRIAPVCGDRRKDPLATYGRPWAGGSLFNASTTLYKPRCELDAVVTILHVFWDKTPLVNRLGFTCWHTRNNAMSNSLPNYGGEAVGNKRLICPKGEIATGIYGRAGGAIDQLGLICAPW